MSEDSEKQHAASEKHRQTFVDKGDVAKSRDLATAVVLCAAAAACVSKGAQGAQMLLRSMRGTWSSLGRAADSSLIGNLAQGYTSTVLPIFGAVALAAVANTVVQSGGRLRLKMPSVDFGKVNPLPRLTQLFSFKETAQSLVTNCVKVAALLAVCAPMLVSGMYGLVTHAPGSLMGGMAGAASFFGSLATRCLGTYLALGLVDYGINWWKLEKRMRMTTQEVRDESKQDSGDGRLRSRRRRKHQELVKSRSVADVKRADVIIVNPTHYAVALSYKSGKMKAPRVVAKGVDAMAERIRAVARRNNVPVVSQPPLARLLYARVAVGKVIPEDMYRAVATVLSHVYRIRGGRAA